MQRVFTILMTMAAVGLILLGFLLINRRERLQNLEHSIGIHIHEDEEGQLLAKVSIANGVSSLGRNKNTYGTVVDFQQKMER